MNKEFKMKPTMNLLLILALACMPVMAQHNDDESEGDHEEESNLSMSLEAADRAGITIGQVVPRQISRTLTVPGEVAFNGYTTAIITPRIAAQVVARHARLGEVVVLGDPLATLSSVEMAEAQGRLVETDAEWQRVESLGREVVSEKRYTEAKVAQQKALAALRAYGMPSESIQSLLQSGGADATGEFVLSASIDGTVIFDDFVLGQFIEPGQILFQVSEESTLWIEASLAPRDAVQVHAGDIAWVVRGDRRLDATVIQTHHRLNETTRRQKVRLEISNAEDLLHPGEFVDVLLPTGDAEMVLSIPVAALTILEGAPTVFAWDGDEFVPVSIETGVEGGEWIAVLAGLESGQEIAFDGVFHLKSLLLRSQLGEGHAH